MNAEKFCALADSDDEVQQGQDLNCRFYDVSAEGQEDGAGGGIQIIESLQGINSYVEMLNYDPLYWYGFVECKQGLEFAEFSSPYELELEGRVSSGGVSLVMSALLAVTMLQTV